MTVGPQKTKILTCLVIHEETCGLAAGPEPGLKNPAADNKNTITKTEDAIIKYLEEKYFLKLSLCLII